MRITRMELHELGPFERAVLEFPEPTGNGELVLFEGPNGCGKTTIAESLARWAFSLHDGTIRVTASHRSRGHSWRFGLQFSNNGLSNETVWEEMTTKGFPFGAPPVRGSNTSIPWTAFAYRGHYPSAQLDADGVRQIEQHPLSGAQAFGEFEPASKHFGQFLLNMEFERIQARLYASEKPDPLQAAPFVRMADSRAASLERIQHALSSVLDRNVEIVFGMGARPPVIRFNGEEIPIDGLGEGLRNTISWLADLLVRLERTDWVDKERSPLEQEFWLILDEIEESLHPRMQAHILPALRELFPNARIYATTHSPFVVASAGEGTVFRIRPDQKTGRVSGKIESVRLEHGQSLEWVVSEIFSAPSGFVDEATVDFLDVHERGINAIRAKKDLDWKKFKEAREFLVGLNEEVRAIVSMREVPVRGILAQKLSEPAQ